MGNDEQYEVSAVEGGGSLPAQPLHDLEADDRAAEHGDDGCGRSRILYRESQANEHAATGIDAFE